MLTLQLSNVIEPNLSIMHKIFFCFLKYGAPFGRGPLVNDQADFPSRQACKIKNFVYRIISIKVIRTDQPIKEFQQANKKDKFVYRVLIEKYLFLCGHICGQNGFFVQ